MSREGPPADPRRAGLLVAVVGPSGVGKDALMAAARAHPALDPRVRFARRTVTRAAFAGAEDHDSLDETDFARAEAAGAFALAWAAHGLRYGVPRSARGDVAAGGIVVANLSRGALAAAAAAFGRLRIVEVWARPEVLLARLTARGREDEATIRARLARPAPMDVPAAAEGHWRLDNSGDLGTAAARLVDHINGLCGAADRETGVDGLDLIVRPAEARDEAAVVALWRACGLVASYNDPSIDFAFARAGACSDVILCEDEDGGLAGTVMVGHDGHRGWLYYVASAPGLRGRGVGRRMVRAGEDWLRERGVAKVQLLVRETNTGVMSFYEGLGYETAPRVVMSRWLTPPDGGQP